MSRLLDTAGQAFWSLLLNKTRTFLTVLGLSVGVGAIVAIGSIGMAGVREVETELCRFGIDKLWIAAPDEGTLRMEDVYLLGRSFQKDSFCPLTQAKGPASTDEGSKNVEIVGTTQAYGGIETLELDAGRFLLAEDETRSLRVAVLEDSVAARLFPSGDAVGRELRLGAGRFTVVGVLKTSHSQFLTDEMPRVYVPLSTFEQQFGVPDLSQIVAKVDENLQTAAASIRQVLADAHDGQRYTLSSLREQIESADRILRIFRMVLLCVGFICLLTGGIGVMNVLLASLKERRTEIGVRKALGARDRDIAVQFVCEALLYGFLGACFGICLGKAFTQIGARLVGIGATLRMDLAAEAVAFSCAVALLSGVYPAVRAARTPPVLAMRPET